MRFPATLQCDIDFVAHFIVIICNDVGKVPQDILASFVGDRSVDWLRNYKGDKPFFLWVSFRLTIRRGRNDINITLEMQP